MVLAVFIATSAPYAAGGTLKPILKPVSPSAVMSVLSSPEGLGFIATLFGIGAVFEAVAYGPTGTGRYVGFERPPDGGRQEIPVAAYRSEVVVPVHGGQRTRTWFSPP